MKKVINISVIFCLFIFTYCHKVEDEPKEYLFDGLPYYFSDTLFYNNGSTRKRLFADNLEIDSKGNVWISSGYRLYKYNPETEVIIPLIYDDLLSIWNFYIDSKDRVWGGGYGSICMFDGDMYKRFYFDDTEVLARSIGEDAEGNIHFNGYENGQEYICDGQSVVRSKPVFAPEDYFISKIFSDKKGFLWYFIDMTPHIEFDNETKIVRYHNENDYKMLDTLPTSVSIDMLKYKIHIAMDYHDSPVFEFGGMVGRINSDMKWETLWKQSSMDPFFPNCIRVDPEDNIWVSLASYAPGSPKMAFLNKKNWVSESLEIIKLRNSVNDFAFPDNNTIWIATSGGVFKFKK